MCWVYGQIIKVFVLFVFFPWQVWCATWQVVMQWVCGYWQVSCYCVCFYGVSCPQPWQETSRYSPSIYMNFTPRLIKLNARILTQIYISVSQSTLHGREWSSLIIWRRNCTIMGLFKNENGTLLLSYNKNKCSTYFANADFFLWIPEIIKEFIQVEDLMLHNSFNTLAHISTDNLDMQYHPLTSPKHLTPHNNHNQHHHFHPVLSAHRDRRASPVSLTWPAIHPSPLVLTLAGLSPSPLPVTLILPHYLFTLVPPLIFTLLLNQWSCFWLAECR